MTPNEPLAKRLSRREVLSLVAAAGAAAVAGCKDNGTPERPTATSTSLSVSTATAAGAATATPGRTALSCVVSPQMTEGPYFVDEQLNRADISADPVSGSVKEGVQLALRLGVHRVSGDTCTPLSGAHVDVWHCDASGLYSDVAANNTVGEKFLRGYQLTDANGAATFTTIYPGWYMGRAVHIHIKVRTDPTSQQGYEFTSQLFFDEATTDGVYAQAPYSSRGTRDTLNANDMVYRAGGDQMLLRLSQDGQGYLGTIDIGLQIA